MASPQLSEIFNFVSVSDDLGTAGQPTAEQLQAVKDAGYDVVINLATGTTPRDLPNEAELLASQELDYVHIPVVWEAPTAENLRQFFKAMDDNQDKKCFVHCIANMRVSAFVYLYRVLRQGVPESEARATMNRLWEPNAVWQNFIDKALAEKP
jgi:protein tyrosine phosphatase (PTP) superfamily phosphohydrolase (DUF442 family)